MDEDDEPRGATQWMRAICFAVTGSLSERLPGLPRDPRLAAVGCLYAAMVLWAKAGMAEPDEQELRLMVDLYRWAKGGGDEDGDGSGHRA